MPKNYTNKKKTYAKKAKKYVKKSYDKTGVVALPKQVQGIPNKMIVHLNYVDTITMGNNLNIIASRTFRCNSLFDPDYTGSGHQPLYFDQLAALYQYYKVNKASISVMANNLSGSGITNNILVGLDILSTDNSIDLDINTIRERAHSKYSMLTTQFPMKKLKAGWNINKSLIKDADGTAALCTANPALVDYFRIYAMSLDGTTVIGTNQISVSVKIKYTAEMYGLVQIAGS